MSATVDHGPDRLRNRRSPKPNFGVNGGRHRQGIVREGASGTPMRKADESAREAYFDAREEGNQRLGSRTFIASCAMPARSGPQSRGKMLFICNAWRQRCNILTGEMRGLTILTPNHSGQQQRLLQAGALEGFVAVGLALVIFATLIELILSCETHGVEIAPNILEPGGTEIPTLAGWRQSRHHGLMASGRAEFRNGATGLESVKLGWRTLSFS